MALTNAMLAGFPPERDVISFTCLVAKQQQMLGVKFLLKNGTHEMLFFPAAIAAHIADSINKGMRPGRWKDVRRGAGDARPQPAVIQAFLDNLPTIDEGDWTGVANGMSRVACGCECHAQPSLLYLGALIDPSRSIYKVLRLPAAIVVYLRDYVAAALEAGDLYFLATPSGSKPN